MDGRFRGDALAGSPHSRLTDEMRPPLQSFDADRAIGICAQISRSAMLDLAPALMFLSHAERLRVQALTAYTTTLFDFARQPGLEGERLAGLNRWQFELEQALDGSPTGQPIFVQLAKIEQATPWLREEFDRLHRVAQHIAVSSGADPIEPRSSLDREIVHAWITLASSSVIDAATIDQGAAVLRLHRLLNLLDASDRMAGRAQETLKAESNQLHQALERRDSTRALAPRQQAAARYLRLASLELLRSAQPHRVESRQRRPKLGVIRRLSLLARVRWLEK
ncbi:MAG: hypothetical protein P8Y44_01035 [Acidobacteriota bacterium]